MDILIGEYLEVTKEVHEYFVELNYCDLLLVVQVKVLKLFYQLYLVVAALVLQQL